MAGRRSPPQNGVFLDKSSPFYSGLSAYTPYSGQVRPNGSGAVLKMGADGLGFTTPVDANYWETTSGADCISTSPTWSVLVVVNGDPASHAGGTTYCERPNATQILKLNVNNDATGGNFPQLVLRDAGGAGLLFLQRGGSGYPNAYATGRAIVGAARLGTTNHRLYLNGDFIASNTSTTVPDNFAQAAATIGHDNQDSAEALDVESIPLILTVPRAWSDEEFARLSANPWQVFRQAPRIYYLGALGGGVSAALTGVAATGAAGTVGPQTAKALTGNAGTGAAGAFAPTTSKALTGNAGTGSVGSVTPVRAGAITGVSSTGSTGTVVPNVTIALTGNQATGAVGTVTAVSDGSDVSAALTGVAGTGSVGTVTPNLSIALTGVSATGAVGSVTAGQPLTGVVGTGSAGDVGPVSSKAITGTGATGATGTASPEITVTLSGVQAGGEIGDLAFAGGDLTIALTGVEATGEAGVLQVAGAYSDIAAAVWGYMLSNGKTAGQNVVEIRALLDTLTPGFWDFVIEGPYTAADLLRVIAAVQAGKTTITPLGAGAATVEFRAVDDSEVRVTADMDGSERTDVSITL